MTQQYNRHRIFCALRKINSSSDALIKETQIANIILFHQNFMLLDFERNARNKTVKGG